MIHRKLVHVTELIYHGIKACHEISYSRGRLRRVPERPDGETALAVAPIPGAVGADDAVLLPAAKRLTAVGPCGRSVVEKVDVDVAHVDELDCVLEKEMESVIKFSLSFESHISHFWGHLRLLHWRLGVWDWDRPVVQALCVTALSTDENPAKAVRTEPRRVVVHPYQRWLKYVCWIQLITVGWKRDGQ